MIKKYFYQKLLQYICDDKKNFKWLFALSYLKPSPEFLLND